VPGPQDKDQVNLTDEESRIIPVSGGGFEQCYNAQASVDVETMLIIGRHLSQNPNDKLEIEPALAAFNVLPESLVTVDALLADDGYYSETNVDSCLQHKILPYISAGRDSHSQTLKERFGEPAPLPDDADSVTQMKHRLKTRGGRTLYSKRKKYCRTGFRHYQSSNGVPPVHAPRSRVGPKRVGSGLYGLEPETVACVESLNLYRKALLPSNRRHYDNKGHDIAGLSWPFVINWSK